MECRPGHRRSVKGRRVRPGKASSATKAREKVSCSEYQLLTTRSSCGVSVPIHLDWQRRDYFLTKVSRRPGISLAVKLGRICHLRSLATGMMVMALELLLQRIHFPC